MPIIFLTARDDEIDRVVGLEIGGDDYIGKPFSMRELLARIKARLRMTHILREQAKATVTNEPSQVAAEFKTFGNFAINEIRREILLNGQPLAVKPKEYELLLFFSQHVGQAISRDYILKNVWDYGFTGDSRTVDVHVRWLREKIEADPSQPARIVTVRGGGYRFEG